MDKLNIYKSYHKINESLELKTQTYGCILEVSIFINKKYIDTLHYCNMDTVDIELLDDIITIYEGEVHEGKVHDNDMSNFDIFMKETTDNYTKSSLEWCELNEELESL